MIDLTETERQYLLSLARSHITAELVSEVEIVRPIDHTEGLLAHCGCFVTLQKAGVLRGCIGNIEATRSLADGVRENAKNAAFRDPRFPPLEASELSDVNIEISVLSVPCLMRYTDTDDLLDKLKPDVHGVIISKGWHSATFLPQVWQQLPRKQEFLEHLCMKASLGKNCWRESDISIKVYTVVHFSESSSA
jgi:AmmeMemoRadiSam system protein A